MSQHRPKSFEDFIINVDRAQQLQKLVATQDFPHTLFYGPPGSGKKTLIKALIREIFGDRSSKTKVETQPWKIEIPGGRKLELEVTTISSTYHVEMNPSDVGNNDRYVISEVIKEMARNRAVETDGSRGFKVLLLYEVDRLTRAAQHALRRTMEKYSSAARLVLCCNNVSKVIDPIKSRCLCLRIPAPQPSDLARILARVSDKENLSLPEQLATRIIQASKGNIRRALLSLEACKATNYPLKADQEVPGLDWEMYIKEIAHDILQEQTPRRLYQVRTKLYELLINCIPPDVILQSLLTELLSKIDDELKYPTVSWAAHFESQIQAGSKPIFHIEAFVARFMSDYKEWMIKALSFD